jgi:hypothetical protein
MSFTLVVLISPLVILKISAHLNWLVLKVLIARECFKMLYHAGLK